jgi:hypothetical protein
MCVCACVLMPGRTTPPPNTPAAQRKKTQHTQHTQHTSRSAVLIGEPGVGKTSIIHGLAQRLAAGDVPDGLAGARLVALELGLLMAGACARARVCVCVCAVCAGQLCGAARARCLRARAAPLLARRLRSWPLTPCCAHARRARVRQAPPSPASLRSACVACCLSSRPPGRR